MSSFFCIQMDNIAEMDDFTPTRAQRVPSPGDRCYGYLRHVILPIFVQFDKKTSY